MHRYTVLICTRNRADTLATALDSHLALAVPAGVWRELLVVDNGSADHTPAVVEAFRRKAGFEVGYLREDRAGHSVALNAGCRAARGEAIAFTDDDAFPAPGWLAALHDTFGRAAADWVYGPVVPRWAKGTAPRWYGPATARLVACLDHGPAGFVAADPEQSFYGVNHAVRRDRLLALGLYREDLGILPGGTSVSGNDTELFARALAAGYKLVYEPRAAVEHLIPAERTRPATHRRITRIVADNQFDHLRANPPAPPTVLGLPRFYYRRLAAHLAGWAGGAVRLDPSRRFAHELQVIRYLTLIGRAAGRRAGERG